MKWEIKQRFMEVIKLRRTIEWRKFHETANKTVVHGSVQGEKNH